MKTSRKCCVFRFGDFLFRTSLVSTLALTPFHRLSHLRRARLPRRRSGSLLRRRSDSKSADVCHFDAFPLPLLQRVQIWNLKINLKTYLFYIFSFVLGRISLFSLTTYEPVYRTHKLVCFTFTTLRSQVFKLLFLYL